MKSRLPLSLSGRSGFTLLEILISVSIIGILAALLIGAQGPILDASRRAACQGNLRQIGNALLMYANDNNGYGPGGDGSSMTTISIGGIYKVFGPLLPYLGVNDKISDLKMTPKVLICPATSPSKLAYIQQKYPGVETSYYMNPQDIAKNPSAGLVKLINLPGKRAVLSDFCYWWNPNTSYHNHKGAGVNVFRLNGSVQWLPASKTQGLVSWSWAALDEL